MTCAVCGHEGQVHDGGGYLPYVQLGRCFLPDCGCMGYRAARAVPVDLFPAPKDEPRLPIAIVYPSRSGRPWAHVVSVVDHPTKPYLTCGCRGYSVRGTCWAVSRCEALIGIPAKGETK